MYTCDECQEDQNHSKYPVPVIMTSENQNKMLHVECCSKDKLLDRLKQISSAEILFYQDVIKITEELDQEKIKNFSEKYGTHDEHKLGIQIDFLNESKNHLGKLL
ncbi:hypothetical protein [Nitrosopumilus sp.]|uniref:hypothetical protein n=1 Tax=Nitrosopumilus sp. TaxID=2024843 RepID=UPI002930EABD|nr:hypothetical protein [Nitrosopumilus sp.]